jgi:hypothetical protein
MYAQIDQITQNSVWRKSASYSWSGDLAIGSSNVNSDGTYSLTAFTSAVSIDQTSAGWQKTAQFTLFDPFSHPLESTDINGNYSSRKMDNLNRFPILSASNAMYSETAYSGAETMGIQNGSTNTNCTGQSEGGVCAMDGVVVNDFSHTGTYSLVVNPGKEGFRYTLQNYTAGNKYRASVWAYFPGEAEDPTNIINTTLYCQYVSGIQNYKSVTATVSKKAGSWYLLDLVFQTDATRSDAFYFGTNNASNQARAVYFDDFRVAPLSAKVQATVISPIDFTTVAVLNNDNLYTRYEYDAANRVIATYIERIGFPVEQMVSTNVYNYVSK